MNRARARVSEKRYRVSSPRPYQLHELFRAPNTVIRAAEVYAWPKGTRRVTVVTVLNTVHFALALKSPAGRLRAYVVDHPARWKKYERLLGVGELRAPDEGLWWARGWKSRAADALRAAAALR